LVEGILTKYVTMSSHLAIILALWICFTYVYPRFRIAPRVALISERTRKRQEHSAGSCTTSCIPAEPGDSRHRRGDCRLLSEGPCTILLDELDQVDAAARRRH